MNNRIGSISNPSTPTSGSNSGLRPSRLKKMTEKGKDYFEKSHKNEVFRIPTNPNSGSPARLDNSPDSPVFLSQSAASDSLSCEICNKSAGLAAMIRCIRGRECQNQKALYHSSCLNKPLESFICSFCTTGSNQLDDSSKRHLYPSSSVSQSTIKPNSIPTMGD